MREAIKGLLLFFVNWIVAAIFFILEIPVIVGNFLQKVLKTPTMPAISVLVDILLVVAVSYLVNTKFVKAERLTFAIAQTLFGISALALFVMAMQVIARGILMNA